MAMPFDQVHLAVLETHGPVTPALVWLLRLVLDTRLSRRVLRDGDVREALSLPEEDECTKEARARTRDLLGQRLVRAERSRARSVDLVSHNAARLAEICRLDATECELLALATMVDLDPALRECFRGGASMPPREVHRLLSVALAAPRSEIARALRPRGALRATRLLQLRPGDRHESCFSLLDGFSDHMAREHRGVDDLITVFVRRAPRGELAIEDFEHMRQSVELVCQLLRGALRTRARGVNVLFYGVPGTGKTELARALAAHLSARLYEVNDEDTDGDPMSGPRRLASCSLAQRVLSQSRRALVVFDEAEDVFPHEYSSYGVSRHSTRDKSWTHRLLETTPVPTIWITNNAEQIDPATLRRFLLALEFGAPPAPVRARMIERRLSRTPMSAAWVARASADERFTPADADKVARVARLLRTRGDADLEPGLSLVVDASLALAGPGRGGAPAMGPTPYSLRFVNASVDVEALASSLGADSQGAICLYGPPGTGKTAFVRHVAERVGRPLQIARASDLLHMFVGQTEQSLARTFRKAAADRAILFLDEVDGMLHDRGLAQRTWEVTQVNELLVQMEGFQGLLFCATNRLEGLDAASMRRFALKIRFDPLRPEQRVELFASIVGRVVDDVAHERLCTLDGLTSGDFAAVMRRFALLRTPVTPEFLLRGLMDEWVTKRGTAKSVHGFRVPPAKGGAA